MMTPIITTLLDTLLSFGYSSRNNKLAGQVRDDSLNAIAKETRMEPLCLLDNTLVGQTYTEDVLQVSLNLLAAYYMQAMSILNIGKGISPVSVLQKLNTSRELTFDTQCLQSSQVDDYGMGLMTTERSTRGYGRPINKGLPPIPPLPAGGSDPTLSVNGIDEVEVKRSNLVIGKVLKIKFDTGNKNTADIFVTLRYDIIEAPPRVIANYVSEGKPDNSLANRIRMLRAGRISFWKEFLFATDLVDEHRKLLLLDRNEVLSTILQRRASGLVHAARGGDNTFGVSSNCLIMSTETMAKAEQVMKGSIESVRVRDGIFQALSLLLIVIVDKTYERITVYYRDRPNGTTLSVKSLKSKGKDNDIGIEELAKMMLGPKTPTF